MGLRVYVVWQWWWWYRSQLHVSAAVPMHVPFLDEGRVLQSACRGLLHREGGMLRMWGTQSGGGCHIIQPIRGITPVGVGRDALEGKRPQRPPQQRLDRRLKEVAKAVEGGYCWLQMFFYCVPLGKVLG